MFKRKVDDKDEKDELRSIKQKMEHPLVRNLRSLLLKWNQTQKESLIDKFSLLVLDRNDFNLIPNEDEIQLFIYNGNLGFKGKKDTIYYNSKLIRKLSNRIICQKAINKEQLNAITVIWLYLNGILEKEDEKTVISCLSIIEAVYVVKFWYELVSDAHETQLLREAKFLLEDKLKTCSKNSFPVTMKPILAWLSRGYERGIARGSKNSERYLQASKYLSEFTKV
jgi:hypothetical protein